MRLTCFPPSRSSLTVVVPFSTVIVALAPGVPSFPFGPVNPIEPSLPLISTDAPSLPRTASEPSFPSLPALPKPTSGPRLNVTFEPFFAILILPSSLFKSTVVSFVILLEFSPLLTLRFQP